MAAFKIVPVNANWRFCNLIGYKSGNASFTSKNFKLLHLQNHHFHTFPSISLQVSVLRTNGVLSDRNEALLVVENQKHHI